jgi:hypothetical protein
MTHPRTLIRQAVQTALLDNTIAEDRVSVNRTNPITQQATARAGRTGFPAIIIYSTTETSVIFEAAPRRYRRTVEIVVECGKEIGPTTELDAELDDFARTVECLLLRDDTMGGTCADFQLTGTSLGIVDQGQKMIGVAALTFEADYYEWLPGDECGASTLDDFQTLHTEYDLSDEDGEADAGKGDTITIDGPPLLLEDGAHLLVESGGYLTEET